MALRALDNHAAASSWSSSAVLYVSTGSYQAPTIAVTTPTIPTAPILVGVRKQVTINWEGVDPNIEPTVALYYATTKSGFAGKLIVSNVIKNAGAQKGSYVWDVTALPVGNYYIYATIIDVGGVGKAYAPGSVVLPTQRQSGGIVVAANQNLRTSENGAKAGFSVHLSKAPTINVIVPLSSTNVREGTVTPASLTFSPKNWSVNQSVTVTGMNDCTPDGNKAFKVLSGKAVTTDPNYIGLSGTPVNVINTDDNDLAGTTNNPNIHICGLSVLKELQVNAKLWKYTLKGQLTNTGISFNGVTAKLIKLPLGVTSVDNTLVFDGARQGDTLLSRDQIILENRTRISAETLRKGLGFKWNVKVMP